MTAGAPRSDAELLQEIKALHHMLRNQLTRVVGSIELLAGHPSLATALQPTVLQIAEDAFAAAGTIDQLQRLTQRLQARASTD
jgi:hypothetical protein